MKFPVILLAPVVLVSFFGVILAANLWELPTQKSQFVESPDKTSEIRFIVDGLFCRGTSNFFINMLSQAPGLINVNTYVQEHLAVIAYDPTKTSANDIREFIESPIRLEDGRIVQPFRVREVVK